MKRSTLLGIVATAYAVGLSLPAFAEGSALPQVQLNGQALPIAHMMVSTNGNVEVDAAEFLQDLGEKVYQVPGGRAMRAFGQDHVITVMADRNVVTEDGELPNTTATWSNGILYAPLDALAQALGATVSHDAMDGHIAIDAPWLKADAAVIPYTDEDVSLLAHVVYAEAADEPYEELVAVAAVILNRVKSPDFPNTIHDVVMQPHQFTGVERPLFNEEPPAEVWQAVKEALAGKDPTGGALYFWNPARVHRGWMDNLTHTVDIGHQRFGY